MNAFMFALNATVPIILTVAVGYLLKRIGWMKREMAMSLNKLVFRLFLPLSLFLNVYKIQNLNGIPWGTFAYMLVGTFGLFALSIPVSMLITPKNERRSVVLQASFRSNFTLIGISLAQSLAGFEGVIVATLLSVATVPLYNILAVISLSMFSNGEKKPDAWKILKEILCNPLIHGILLGALMLVFRNLFENAGIGFRLSDVKPIYSVLESLACLATPLALLALGGLFEFSSVGFMRREIIAGVLMRTAVSPILFLGIAFLFFRSQFQAAHFAALVALSATPVAISSTPMAQEMGQDASLAGQLVVWTTVVSSLSIFFASFWLSLGGVFGV